MIRWLRSFVPAPLTVSAVERLRSLVGAFVGLLLTGVLCTWASGSAGPWLIAPIGASAVLLFAVPASPLAQPWSIVGGNTLAALIGVTCSHWIADRLIAASLAAALAIGAMFFLRCLHPPSGAVALTAVLGGPAIAAAGYHFVLTPVASNSVILMLAAVVFNNASGRRYPHAQLAEQSVHRTTDQPPTLRGRLGKQDLDEVLARYDQVLDVSRDELEALFQAAALRAFDRLFIDVTCADIMSRYVIAVRPETSLSVAWDELVRHDIRAMPVVDAARLVVGIVSDRDFLRTAAREGHGGKVERLPALVWHGTVADIMETDTRTVQEDAHVVTLVPLMADAGIRQIAVTGPDRQLTGIITQSDLVGALCRSRLMAAEPGAERPEEASSSR